MNCIRCIGDEIYKRESGEFGALGDSGRIHWQCPQQQKTLQKKYHQMVTFLEFEVRLTVRMRCVGSPGREGVHCMFGRWGALVASWQ